MNQFLVALVAAGALALAAGPARSQPLAPGATPGIAAKLIARGDLQGIQVTDLRSQVRNDVIVVQAEIYNFYTTDANLYFRFRWTDSGGMQVGDGEVWKPLAVLGRQSKFLKGTAPSPKATDFLIEMSAEPR